MKCVWKLTVWTVCVLVWTTGVMAQVESPLTVQQAIAVDQAVQAELGRQQVPGIAVGIIQQGKIAFLKGYGWANRDTREPATIQTVFNWASNSKPIAAVLAMQLVEQGKLDLDADVRQYIPEFPEKDHVVTVRHLLCHQSGLPHYTNGPVIPTERSYTDEQPFLNPIHALDKFNRSPLMFQPGDQTAYSSPAYVLLSAVVQRAGDQPYAEQLQQRIAGPLGLKSLQLDVESRMQPHWSVGYQKNAQGEIVPAPEEPHYWKHGAGGYKGDVVDLARWAQGLLNHRLVNEHTEKLMWTRQFHNNGQITDWGLGFTIAEQPELTVSHNGSQTEAVSRMVLYPQQGLGIVVLCNANFGKPDQFTHACLQGLMESASSSSSSP